MFRIVNGLVSCDDRIHQNFTAIGGVETGAVPENIITSDGGVGHGHGRAFVADGAARAESGMSGNGAIGYVQVPPLPTKIAPPPLKAVLLVSVHRFKVRLLGPTSCEGTSLYVSGNNVRVAIG